MSGWRSSSKDCEQFPHVYDETMSKINDREEAFEEMAKIETFIGQSSALLKERTPDGNFQVPLLVVYSWCCETERLYPWADREELFQAILELAGLDSKSASV